VSDRSVEKIDTTDNYYYDDYYTTITTTTTTLYFVLLQFYCTSANPRDTTAKFYYASLHKLAEVVFRPQIV